jgi:hypothetical protein
MLDTILQEGGGGSRAVNAKGFDELRGEVGAKMIEIGGG